MSLDQKITTWLAAIVSVAASVCLAFLMLVVVADVSLRAINPDWRITGMLDYVEFSLNWLVFLAIPLALLKKQIVTVDLVNAPNLVAFLKPAGLVLTVMILILLATQIVRPALDTLEWGETTLDLGILKFYYWIAVWVGIGLSCIAALLLLWHTIKDRA